MEKAKKRKGRSLLNSFLNANRSTLKQASSLIEEISQVDTQVGIQVDHKVDTLVDHQPDPLLDTQIGTQVDTPTTIPTNRPTSTPTKIPSNTPSSLPSKLPSSIPTSLPTSLPSNLDEPPGIPATDLPYLTEKQLILYLCIKKVDGNPTNLTKIARATNISENTLKKCLKKLRDTGLVRYFGFCKYGKLSGFTAKVTNKKFYFADTSRHLVSMIEKLDPRILYLSDDLAEYLANDHPDDLAEYLAKDRPNTRARFSHSSSNYKDLLQIDIQTLYPKLHKVGFDESHLKQIIKSWTIQEIDLSLLPDSLEKAEWTLAHDTGKIENPLYYVLSPLKRGPFATPHGFKSRKVMALEQAAKQAAEEAKEIREIEEQRFEDEFLIWWTQLSEEEKEKVDSENTVLPKEGKLRTNFRKDWFRKNVFKPLV